MRQWLEGQVVETAVASGTAHVRLVAAGAGGSFYDFMYLCGVSSVPGL